MQNSVLYQFKCMHLHQWRDKIYGPCLATGSLTVFTFPSFGQRRINSKQQPFAVVSRPDLDQKTVLSPSESTIVKSELRSINRTCVQTRYIHDARQVNNKWFQGN